MNLGYISMIQRPKPWVRSGSMLIPILQKKVKVHNSAGKVILSVFGTVVESFWQIILQRDKSSVANTTEICWASWELLRKVNAAVCFLGSFVSYLTMHQLTHLELQLTKQGHVDLGSCSIRLILPTSHLVTLVPRNEKCVPWSPI